MADRDLLDRRALARIEGGGGHEGALWAVVLAGGEGVRLRTLVREVWGDERPKQYVPLLESRSLLQQTVDRLHPLVPFARTVLVTMRSHAAYLAATFTGVPRPHVLAQPVNRGTAAAILLAAHWVLTRDPDATMIVAPSDHLIVEEASFMAHLAAVARFVQEHPEWMTLLGARPADPEREYGWIEPGRRVGRTDEGPLYRVVRFWEKPSRELATTLLAKGCLWNTFVLVARARTLVAAGEEWLPELNARLDRMATFFDTELEIRAMDQAYAPARSANFSEAVLHRCPRSLAVSKLPAVTWCDLGSPDRVLTVLARLGMSPPWLSALPHPA